MMDSGQLDFYQHSTLCTNTCRSTKFDLLINNTRFPPDGTGLATPTSSQGENAARPWLDGCRFITKADLDWNKQSLSLNDEVFWDSSWLKCKIIGKIFSVQVKCLLALWLRLETLKMLHSYASWRKCFIETLPSLHGILLSRWLHLPVPLPFFKHSVTCKLQLLVMML